MSVLIAKLRLYWPLIKSLQTGLLLSTGLAGYLSAHHDLSLPELIEPGRQPVPGDLRQHHLEYVVRPRYRPRHEPDP